MIPLADLTVRHEITQPYMIGLCVLASFVLGVAWGVTIRDWMTKKGEP